MTGMVRSAHTAPLRHAAQADQGRQFLAPAVQPQHSCTHLSATLTPPRTRRCGVRCRRHACRGGPRCGWLLRRNRRGDMAVSSSRGRIVFSGVLPGPTPCLRPPFAGRPSVRAVSRPPRADACASPRALRRGGRPVGRFCQIMCCALQRARAMVAIAIFRVRARVLLFPLRPS